MLDPGPASHLSVDDARGRIEALCRARRAEPESIPLGDALGRVLARDLVATHDLPPFANSAMDGFALRAADLPDSGERALRLIGTRLAGDGQARHVGPDECLRITTGAPMPDGADTVVIKERVEVVGESVIVHAGETAGGNVRPAGEDYRAGECALRAGLRLGPARLGVAASLGLGVVPVAPQPRVALLTTGDELVEPGQPLGPAQIHNSNRYTLAALVRGAGARLVRERHVRDDRARLREEWLAAAAQADLVLSSGGVSAGEADHLPALLAELGEVHFWKVRMKPGMPLLCGTIGTTPVLALPGNPVSCIATFLALVQPGLAAMQGASDEAPPLFVRLATPIDKRHARAEFLRARLESREDGSLWAWPLQRQGSGMLRGVAEGDALLVIDEGPRRLEAGAVVRAMRLPAG